MNKRIHRYKAWDTVNKRWTQSGIQFNNTKMELEIIPGIVLLDFTGKYDNKESELYEKDIIKCSISQTQHYWGVIEWENCQFVVKAFWFKQDKIGDWQNEYELASTENLRLGDVVNIKKLGNIYENPELLKGGTK